MFARVLASVLALAPALAHAGAPPPTPIWNGQPAGVCDWPSVVQMGDSCTGTLVHPQVVIYAGHCGSDYGTVYFGEGLESVGGSAATEFCVARDGVGIGRDYAVCKLKAPVTDVPIVPILMGCETDALKVGATATFVGFGEAEPPLEYGVKRVGHSTIQGFADDEVFIQSDDGMDTCFGDSGGPVFIPLPDGTWRVFGITSYGESSECGTGTWYSMMHSEIGWFEAQVGLDLTPCHTPDGTWDPTAACGGFPTDPGAGVGTWADACGPGPVGGASETCGAAFGASDDTTPPLAEVVEPTSGLEYMAVDGLPLKISGTARDAADKPDGWGVTEVRLVINDQQLANSAHIIPPYAWNVKLPGGQYLIQIWAVDNAGNEGLSPPVAIGVNEPPPELPEPDVTTGEAESTGVTPTDGGEPPDASSSEGGEVDSSGDPDEDEQLPPEESACGCQAPAPSMLLAGCLALARRRRRR
jgi:hypothetical protein